jgi:hypothetical protein
VEGGVGGAEKEDGDASEELGGAGVGEVEGGEGKGDCDGDSG